jgi:hypothetical protein
MNQSPFFAAISFDDPLWIDIVPQDREIEFFKSPVKWIRARTDPSFPSTFVIHIQGPLDDGTPGMLIQGIAGTNVVALRPSLFQLSLLSERVREFIASQRAATFDPWRVYVEDNYAATHTEIFPGGLDPVDRATRLRDHLFATATDPAVLNDRLLNRGIEEHHRAMGGAYGSGSASLAYSVQPIADPSSVAILYTSTDESTAQACEAVTAGVQGRLIVVQTSITKDYLVEYSERFARALEEQRGAKV